MHEYLRHSLLPNLDGLYLLPRGNVILLYVVPVVVTDMNTSPVVGYGNAVRGVLRSVRFSTYDCTVEL